MLRPCLGYSEVLGHWMFRPCLWRPANKGEVVMLECLTKERVAADGEYFKKDD